jgi:hypothetical protein
VVPPPHVVVVGTEAVSGSQLCDIGAAIGAARQLPWQQHSAKAAFFEVAHTAAEETEKRSVLKGFPGP